MPLIFQNTSMAHNANILEECLKLLRVTIMFLISVYYYYKCNSNDETTFECQSRSHELDFMKPFVKVVKFIVLGSDL